MLIKESSAFSGMMSGIAENFRNFGQAVKDNVGLRWQAVKGVSAPITKPIANMLNGGANGGVSAFGKTRDALGRAGHAVADATAPARQAMGTASNYVKDVAGTAGNYAKDMAGRGLHAVQNSRAMGAINRGVFQRTSNWLRNKGLRMGNYVRGTLGDEYMKLTDQAEQMLRNPVYAGEHMGNADTIRQMAAGTAGDLLNNMASPYHAMFNGINRMATGISNFGNRLNGIR